MPATAATVGAGTSSEAETSTVAEGAGASLCSGTWTWTHLLEDDLVASVPLSGSASASVQASTSVVDAELFSRSASSDDVVGAVDAVLSEDERSGVGFSTLTTVTALGTGSGDGATTVAEESATTGAAAGVDVSSVSDSESESDGDDSLGVSTLIGFFAVVRLALAALSF